MKTIKLKKWRYLLVLLLLGLGGLQGHGQTTFEPHTPYPIIFVHGLVGSGDSWSSDYDIIDFLTEPESNAPLKFGGKINVSLDYNRSFLLADNTKGKDVKILTGKNDISEGDLYIVNFDIRRDGSQPDGFKGTGEFLLSDPGKIHVNDPDLYRTGDLLRIQDEFLRIQSIQGNELTVERGLNGSTSGSYLPGLSINILNISNESNQASIAKQGYGLKQVIDLVKDKTHAEKVILVGHSMGGLASREFIRGYFNNDVAKLVTIGTPHKGSNLTKSPAFLQQLLNIDKSSEAVRDLETGSENFLLSNLGIYIYGGNEKSVDENFYSKDINGDGNENDQIEGLNENDSYLDKIAITYIVSLYFDANIYVGANDGVVLTKSQYYKNSMDTIMTNRFHISTGLFGSGETKDVYSLIRGLDEPLEKELAYEIGKKSINKGFITYQKDNISSDGDLYKVVLTQDGKLKVKILANNYTGINLFQILDEDLHSKVLETNINNTIEYDALAGTYYVRIYGTANNQSWQYPYTLETQFEPAPIALMSIVPNSLQFYDAIIGSPKQKTIKLTNNGTTTISVTGLALTGTNADQFVIITSAPFDLVADASKDVSVRFNPNTIGEKVASFEITTNAPDLPQKTVSLKGNGTDHETKVLVCNPAVTYNFGDTKVNVSRSKTVTIQNTGSNPFTISELTIEGLNPETYSFTSAPTVPFDLVTGQSKQITVKFSPTSIGSKSAILAITNNSDNISPKYSIDLYGNGTENYYSGSYNNIVAYEYWFDDQYQAKVKIPVPQQQESRLDVQIPTDELIIGLHSLHIRYKDQKGKWSSVVSEFFQKLPKTAIAQKIVESEYWFDDDFASKVMTPVSPGHSILVNCSLEVGKLQNGLHSYHVRYKDDVGQWSSVASAFFQKLQVTAEGSRNITTCEYWFDDNFAAKISTKVSPDQTILANSVHDVGSLQNGLHRYHVRYKDDAGQWSSVSSVFFQKLSAYTSTNNLITTYRYWFDVNETDINTINLPEPVNLYQLIRDINISSLSNGVHYIHFQFRDSRGAWSSVSTNDIQNLNEAPVANAGIDQSVNEGSIVTLNGLNSSSPSRKSLTYKWTAPNGIVLSSKDETNPTFLAPEVKNDSMLVFTLIVNDGVMVSYPSQVNITVINVIETNNEILGKNDFKIYPNPVTNELIIVAENNYNKIEFEIIVVTGQVVLSGNLFEKIIVPMNSFDPGMYLIKFKIGNTFKFMKIVKK
jgi:hypothetical protein